MAGDIQAINYITSCIEKLPINDSGFANERLPSIFFYQENSERNSKGLILNKVSGQRRDNGHSRSLYDCRTSLSENSKTLFDGIHETKLKNSQKRFDLVNRSKPSLSNEDIPTCARLRDECDVLSTNKRKRSTDSTESDTFLSVCDEEISRICEGRTFRNFHVHVKPSLQRHGDDIVHSASPSSMKRSLCKSQPEQKKLKPCPAVEVMKRRATPSNSWLPFNFRCSERKVRVIRVTPINTQKKGTHRYFGERFHEERFFRPIRADE